VLLLLKSDVSLSSKPNDMTQVNIHNAKVGEVFTYTNQKNYTTEVVVMRVEEKSVYTCWLGREDGRPMRESWNTFNKFSRKNNTAIYEGVECEIHTF